MIRFDHVSFAYTKDADALTDISFTACDREAVGLIGANGAGKSTLLKVLLGLLPHRGLITVDDLEVNKENLKDIRKKLGFVFQNSDNQMFMPTVCEDIMFAPLNYGIDKQEAGQRTDAVLAQLRLEHLKHKYNHKLSDGEKKMAAIAAVLVMQPQVLLMDEPTSTLDPYNRRIIINTINSLTNTKIIASHDLNLIFDTCQKVIFLAEGRIVAQGTTEKILTDKELLEAHRLELPLGKR